MRPIDLPFRMRLADAVLVVGAMLAAGLLCGAPDADARARGAHSRPPAAIRTLKSSTHHGHHASPAASRRMRSAASRRVRTR